MALKYSSATHLVEAILYAAYFSLAGGTDEVFPVAAGMTGMLAMVGLCLKNLDDGIDILDGSRPIVRVRWMDTADGVSLYVEPAQILFKALDLLGQPYQKTERTVYQ